MPESLAPRALGYAGNLRVRQLASRERHLVPLPRVLVTHLAVRLLPLLMKRADLGDKGVFYRLQAGPLSDAAAAETLCGKLKQRNVGCLIVRP